jgi:GTP-binding protein Era
MKKAGYVALLGLPNAGKSTLTNALVGEKVSIVTPKPQTTRGRVLGLLCEDSAQIIFVDAPGYIESEAGLNPFLKAELQSVLQDADMLLVVLNLDAENNAEIDAILALARASHRPWMAVITKADKGLEHRTLIIKSKLNGEPAVVGSALKKPHELREQILPWVKEHLPEVEEFYFPEDDYTTQNLRQMSAEMIREQCFEYLHQEIPYGLAIRIEKFVEEDIVKIYAQILVEKENHKGMVIGKSGEMLKRIGSSARRDLEKLVGRQVFLQLHVDVQLNWQKNPRVLKELGYVITE